MEQKRKRSIDEKSKHIHSRQRREQFSREYDDIDHQLRQYKHTGNVKEIYEEYED